MTDQDPASDEDDTNGSAIPPFPRVGSNQRIRLAREARFRAWVGRPEKLVHIAKQVEDALASIYESETAKLQPDDLGRSSAQFAADNLRMRVSVKGAGGRLERTGSLAAILAEMDVREIESVTFGNSAPESTGFPAIQVHMRTRSSGEMKVIELKVQGGERQWVGGIVDVLSAELRSGVPRWAFMRSGWFALMVSLFVALGIAGMFYGVRGEDLPSEPGAILALGVFVTFAGGFGALLLVLPILVKLFPGLEIVEAGGTAKGRQVLAIAVTGLSIALGIAGVLLAL